MGNDKFEKQLGQLWATRLAIDVVDLTTSSVVLRFVGRDRDGVETARRVRLERVESIALIATRIGRWAYAEATEVGLRNVDDHLEFGVVLWDEPDELIVACHRIWLDDAVLDER